MSAAGELTLRPIARPVEHTFSTAAGRMLLLGMALTASLAQTRPVDPLALARDAYNAQRYDVAISRADEARKIPASADAASVVFARAHLERYRVNPDPADLIDARAALKQVDAAKLSPRDHLEYLIGLGESIFLDDGFVLDDRYGAAAELFELALSRGEVLDTKSRDLLFEWWALSLDRQAQQVPDADRPPIYERVVRRAEAELAQPEGAISSSYWLAAGPRGTGHPARAMGAAAAGWTRAASLGARGERETIRSAAAGDSPGARKRSRRPAIRARRWHAGVSGRSSRQSGEKTGS